VTDSARPQAGVPGEPRPEGVFDALPHGALVLDADGSVLEINPPAAELLGDGDGPATRGARCCELLGCAERGSPHGPGCLADMARRPGKTIPEFRVDVASGSAWVAARRLTDGRIVAQVRPGGESDSRAIAAWTAGRHVTIRALGRTEVEVPDAPGDQTWVRQRPGQLLKLLVTERRRPVTTVEIAEALWPGGPSARNATVRALVHHLRRRLDGDGEGEGKTTTSIAHVGGGYRLRAERVAVDVDAFEAAARFGLDDARADRAAEARDCPSDTTPDTTTSHTTHHHAVRRSAAG